MNRDQLTLPHADKTGLEFRCALGAQAVPWIAHKYRETVSAAQSTNWMVNPSLLFSKGGCPARHIHFADAVALNEPMVWVEDLVTSVVFPFALSHETAKVVRALQPGCAVPRRIDEKVLSRMIEFGLIYDAEALPLKIRSWRNLLRRTSSEFHRGYTCVGPIFNPHVLGAIRAYFNQFLRLGMAHHGDLQTPLRWVAHNEMVSRFIHYQLLKVVEAIAGISLKPSYCYLVSYEEGASLPLHVDREQCEISLSVLIDYSPEPDEESPWPFKFKIANEVIEIHQRIGDSLMYRGRELPHFRRKLPRGHTSTSLIFHFVPRGFLGSLL